MNTHPLPPNNQQPEWLTTSSYFTFDHHLHLYLHFNKRLVTKDWRNTTEENIVRDNEAMHCYYAQLKMPPDFSLDN